MSTGENRQNTRAARNAWLLSTPALVILTLAATGPLLIMLVYSFLTAREVRQRRMAVLHRRVAGHFVHA